MVCRATRCILKNPTAPFPKTIYTDRSCLFKNVNVVCPMQFTKSNGQRTTRLWISSDAIVETTKWETVCARCVVKSPSTVVYSVCISVYKQCRDVNIMLPYQMGVFCAKWTQAAIGNWLGEFCINQIFGPSSRMVKTPFIHGLPRIDLDRPFSTDRVSFVFICWTACRTMRNFCFFVRLC